MKTEQEIKETIAMLKQDERLYYPRATVFENAPLSLIQLAMETQIHTLETILEIPLTTFPLKHA